MRYTPVSVGPVTVELESHDRIAQKLERGEPFEPETRELFPSLMREGSNFLDIGCYSGLFSIAAMKLGAYAFGFEPMDENRRQIVLNQQKNKTLFPVYPVAVSDKRGEGSIAYNPKVKLTAGASLDRKSGPRRSVELVTIDSYNFEDVCCIKIDIEGHEPAALRGMRETLKREKPMLIVEANDEAHREAVERELYNVYKLDRVLDIRNLILSPV